MNTPECPSRPLSLDEAIAHADEVAGDCGTACQREHKQLADWLRELKSRRSAECGDAAKLCEALTKVKEWIEHRIATCGFEPSATFPTMLEDVVLPALAAPRRNCDRPECATLEMATKTWILEELGPHCNNSKATMADIRTFDVWIYAPATEKKGGAK